MSLYRHLRWNNLLYLNPLSSGKDKIYVSVDHVSVHTWTQRSSQEWEF